MRLHPTLLLLAATAQAQSSPPIPTPTHDWGCEVLLCLANPNGPEAVQECVPPIERLWRALAEGHAFPSCTMAQTPQCSGQATLRSSFYDACPSGTAAVDAGRLVMLSGASPPPPPNWSSGAPTTYAPANQNTIYSAVGDGDGIGQNRDDAEPPKVCASGAEGTRTVMQGDNDLLVDVFDTVYVEPAQPSSRAIDVYINDQLWQTVRW